MWISHKLIAIRRCDAAFGRRTKNKTGNTQFPVVSCLGDLITNVEMAVTAALISSWV